MIQRDTTVLDKFLAKVRDSNKLGLKEVRIDTKDAVDIAALLAQILLDSKKPNNSLRVYPSETSNKGLDGGSFK